MPNLRKVGLAVIRDNRILLCRKKNGLPYLILPGGKLLAEESPIDCLHREIQEELGPVLAPNVSYLGIYTSPAAVAPGEAPATIEIKLYLGELAGEPIACGEIAELVWFDPCKDPSTLAPSIANLILPDLLERGLLQN